MGRGRSRNWNVMPTLPTPPEQWYQQSLMYPHIPDNVSMNWQQRMKMPNTMNLPRSNFVPPFQQQNQPQKTVNHWRPMPQFVPLQADKKMRQTKGEVVDKNREPSQKNTSVVPETKKIKERTPSAPPTTSANPRPQSRCRIAAKFSTPMSFDQ